MSFKPFPTDEVRLARISAEVKAEIDAMDREALACKWRFAPAGDKFWQGDKGWYAMRRFKELGGFNSEISKKIGWPQ